MKTQSFRHLNLYPGVQFETLTSVFLIQSFYKKQLRKLSLGEMLVCLLVFFFESYSRLLENLFKLKRTCYIFLYENNISFILILILKYSWALLEHSGHSLARFLCQKAIKHNKGFALHHNVSLLIWEQPTMKHVI